MHTQSCPTLCHPMDCSPLGSSVRGVFQTRVLEWVAISFSRESSWPRDLFHLLHWQEGSLPVIFLLSYSLILLCNQEINEVFIKYLLQTQWASLVAQMVKNPPALQETRVQSLGQEDSLEKEMATHSSILAWRIPWTEKPGRLQSMRLQRVGHD